MNFIEILKKYGILSVILLVTGFSIGKFSSKKEIETKEVIKEVKIVDEQSIRIAIEEAKKEWEKNTKQKTIIVEVEKPDGTKEKTTVVETEENQSSKESTSNKETEETKKTEVVSTEVEKKISEKPAMPEYSLGVQIHKEIKNIFSTLPQDNLDYSVNVGKRVIGGIWADSSFKVKSKEFGIGIRWEF